MNGAGKAAGRSAAKCDTKWLNNLPILYAWCGGRTVRYAT